MFLRAAGHVAPGAPDQAVSLCGLRDWLCPEGGGLPSMFLTVTALVGVGKVLPQLGVLDGNQCLVAWESPAFQAAGLGTMWRGFSMAVSLPCCGLQISAEVQGEHPRAWALNWAPTERHCTPHGDEAVETCGRGMDLQRPKTGGSSGPRSPWPVSVGVGNR